MENKELKQPGLLQVFGSVLAAGFGVQRSDHHERDFAKGKPSQYIIVGLTFTILFVLAIYGVVRLVLNTVGV